MLQSTEESGIVAVRHTAETEDAGRATAGTQRQNHCLTFLLLFLVLCSVLSVGCRRPLFYLPLPKIRASTA